MIWCYIACSLAALCAFFYAIKSYQKKTHLAMVTGTMFLAACAVNLTYLARIWAGTYFVASLTTSAYFVCLDFLLLSMIYYMVEFTQSRTEPNRGKKAVVCTAHFLVFTDAVVLIGNVFHETILRYQYHADSVYAIKYMYEASPGFYLHLILTYVLVAAILYILVRKTISVPEIYRARYANTLLALCVIGFLTIFYMTGALKVGIDLAVPAYGLACPLVYISAFDYSSKGMLNTTRKMVLEYMDMPMILFDYEGYMADTNKDMRDLFPVLNNQESRISMMDFLQIGEFQDLQSTGENQSSQKSSLLDSLTQTLTESDYETEEHVERTREMAIRLGKALNLADGDLGKLALLAVLHDIGKIAIPHSILLKPGKLTDAEWEVMKSHTEKGYRIVSASKELKPIGEYILHHHERWDGGGYPGGLAGEEIPLLSRIITVVDSHDVMVHDRPYHKAMSAEAAREELLRCAGTQFDPKLVEVFMTVLEEEKVS